MKLKRGLAMLLVLCMVLPLAACAGNGDANTTTTAGGVTTTVNQAADPNVDATTTVATDEEGNEVTTTVATDEEGNEITTTTTVATDAEGNTVATTTTTTKQGETTKTTTTKKGETTTTKKSKVSKTLKTQTQKQDGPVTIGQITVKEGTVKMDKGLDFGGKTFRFAQNGANVSSRDSDYGKMYTIFEDKYNCKLDISAMAMNEYTEGVAAAMAGGDPYDIVFMYDEWFPAQITANLMLPLDDYFTTADLWTNKSKDEGGLSYSLSEAMSLNGHVYVVGGAYLATPGMIWYNKKMFADAGYDGANDPLALYNAGKWTWEKYYEILSDIQDVDAGRFGMNSISPYYSRMMFGSYGTDIAKKTSTSITQNLGDAQLYKAFEMMQKFNYGAHSVCDPKNQYENGIEQFMNGTTASLMGNAGYAWTLYEMMDEKTYSSFGSKAQQKKNLGMVPLPVANSKGVHAIWAWMGYGAGNGTDEDGIKAAIAWSLVDSIHNHKNVYHPEMPSDILKVALEVADSDKLVAPMHGFSSSAGSLGGIQTEMCSKIANKGENITVVLKGYEKKTATIINQAMKSSNS